MTWGVLCAVQIDLNSANESAPQSSCQVGCVAAPLRFICRVPHSPPEQVTYYWCRNWRGEVSLREFLQRRWVPYTCTRLGSVAIDIAALRQSRIWFLLVFIPPPLGFFTIWMHQLHQWSQHTAAIFNRPYPNCRGYLSTFIFPLGCYLPCLVVGLNLRLRFFPGVYSRWWIQVTLVLWHAPLPLVFRRRISQID